MFWSIGTRVSSEPLSSVSFGVVSEVLNLPSEPITVEVLPRTCSPFSNLRTTSTSSGEG